MEMTVPAPVALAEVPALIVTPHPVSLQGQRVLSAAAAQFTPGESLASLLERQGVLPGQQWVVTIDGFEVPASMWLYTRPKHGTLIECRRVPQKDALRIIAVAALSYFTFGAGGLGAAGGFAGMGTTAGAWAAAAGTFLAGSLVINKMLAPKMPGRGGAGDQNNSPTYSLAAGGRNRARLFEPMGLVLGEPYAVPDMGAQPYTFFSGGEQFLWQIFHLGINCAEAQSLRVGQTALELYQGVSVLRNGLASGNSAFPALGTSVDSIAGAPLEAPPIGAVWVTRTSSVGTVLLALDFVAQLFNVDNQGVFNTRTVDVEIEYRELGSPTWLPFTPAIAEVPAVTRVVDVVGGDDSGNWSYPITEVVVPAVPAVPAGITRLRNASQKPLRVTVQKYVAPGQYEVRARKGNDDFSGSQGSNQLEWAQLRSYQQDLANYDGQARLAIQIQASGQLNGTLDELNAALRAKPMPYWNGSAWITATDRASGLCNPGAIFLLLARGIFDSSGKRLAGLGYSDSQIDIEGLKRFMVRCKAKGFDFDYFVQETLSLQDLLDAIAYAGLGEMGWPDGKLGVVFFSEDDPIEGVINMANVKARSFSVDYETMPTADEIEVQYFDRFRGNAWRSLRVMAPGVTNPRATARLQLMGVTSEAHAAVLGRFAMAQNIFQRKTVTLEQDLEYMTHRRGAVVSLSHDLTQWGYSGRLQAAQDVAGEIHLTLDERAPGTVPVGGSGRFIGLRLPGESAPRIFPVKAFVGESRVIVLDGAWPAGVSLPGSTADNPAHDTLWIYDFKATPGQRLLVAGIEPSGDGARLTLVPIGPEFWSYVFTGAYTPPPNNSLLRSAPTVTRVRMTEQLARQGNTFYTQLSLYFEVDGPFDQAELWGAVGAGEVAPTSLIKLDTSRSQSLTWRGGLDERWHLDLRVRSSLQQGEPYRLFYDVQGLRSPPPPFDVFTVLAQPDGTRQFNFGYTVTAAPADWLGAEIRYLSGAHVTPAWDTMEPLQNELTHYTASPVEANRLLGGVHTFACRSIDTTWNASEVSYFQLDLPPRRLGNVVAEFDDGAEGWLGVPIDATINTDLNRVEAKNLTTWGDLTTWDAWIRWTLDPENPITYLTVVRDLSASLTTLVDAAVVAEGDFVVALRGSETSNDPDADPSAWSAWGPADEKIRARYIQLRVTVTANAGNPVPGLLALTYVASAPLINEYINDVDISTLTGSYRMGTGDVRVPKVNTYGTLLELQVVIQDASAGAWSWQLIDKTMTFGPRVQFKLNGVLADPDLVDFIVRGF